MVNLSIGQALVGGSCIAGASCLMMWTYGRLIGESGFISKNLKKEGGWINWQLTFLVGMVLAPTILRWIFDGSLVIDGKTIYFYNPILGYTCNIFGWIIGGLLVGIGARMGCGCTSGHIITGLPRLTKRSIFSSVIILAAGVVMANIRNQLTFLDNSDGSLTLSADAEDIISYVVFCLILISYGVGFFCEFASLSIAEHLVMFGCGTLFGAGLLISGLCNNLTVINFMTFTSSWDATLPFIFGFAVVVNFLVFMIIDKAGSRNGSIEHPPHETHFSQLLGAGLFGLGWGFCGIAPGSALILVISQPNSVYFFVSMILGMILYDYNVFKLRKGSALEESLL